MIHSDKGADPPDKEDLRRSTPSNPEDGLSQILRLVLQELNLFYSRDVSGLCLLYDLLHSPWLQALLKVYDCLQEFKGKKLLPATSQARALSYEVVEMLHAAPGSPEIQELRQILQAPHFKPLKFRRNQGRILPGSNPSRSRGSQRRRRSRRRRKDTETVFS